MSTEEQETENQAHELREFCERQGWELYREYTDQLSGKSADRPQFQAMLQDASRRKFDLVLFWALDRLTREGTLATLRYIEQLEGWGVAWRSFTEPYIDSAGPFRDVVISLMSTLAKQERLKISERTKAGLRRAKREGKRLGRAPLGVQASQIRELQASGLSLRQIAAQTGWSLSTVTRTLKAEKQAA